MAYHYNTTIQILLVKNVDNLNYIIQITISMQYIIKNSNENGKIIDNYENDDDIMMINDNQHN